MNRVDFGIEKLDNISQGGIPEGNSILICGSPGTGKTIMALQYLYYGATQKKEKGIYITIEESPKDLKRQAMQFGWDFEKLEKSGLVRFVKIPIDTANTEIFKMIGDTFFEMKDVKRMVVDSLSILSINASMYVLPIKTRVEGKDEYVKEGLAPTSITMGDETKQFIYIFASKVSELGATTIFIGDSPEKGEFITRDTVSEFVCDGVIKLEIRQLGKTIVRTMEVKKMRSTRSDPGIHTLEITDRGIDIKDFEY